MTINQTQAAVAEMPKLSPVQQDQAIPYNAIRYISGYTENHVKAYATEYGSACMALKEAEVVRLGNNRDMWKEQCRVQAEKLAGLRAAIVETRRVLNQHNNGKVITDTIWRGDAETLFDYIENSIQESLR